MVSAELCSCGMLPVLLLLAGSAEALRCNGVFDNSNCGTDYLPETFCDASIFTSALNDKLSSYTARLCPVMCGSCVTTTSTTTITHTRQQTDASAIKVTPDQTIAIAFLGLLPLIIMGLWWKYRHRRIPPQFMRLVTKPSLKAVVKHRQKVAERDQDNCGDGGVVPHQNPNGPPNDISNVHASPDLEDDADSLHAFPVVPARASASTGAGAGAGGTIPSLPPPQQQRRSPNGIGVIPTLPSPQRHSQSSIASVDPFDADGPPLLFGTLLEDSREKGIPAPRRKSLFAEFAPPVPLRFAESGAKTLSRASRTIGSMQRPSALSKVPQPTQSRPQISIVAGTHKRAGVPAEASNRRKGNTASIDAFNRMFHTDDDMDV